MANPRIADVNSEAIEIWLETLTTMEVTKEGLIQQLSHDQWQKRSQRLHQLGGPPDLFPASSSQSK